MVAGCQGLGSKKDGMGKREVGFSEVKPAVGAESSEEVLEPQVGGFRRETWRTSHAQLRARRWPGRNHAGSWASLSAWSAILHPSGPSPSSLGRPSALAPAPLYPVRLLHFTLRAPRCVLQKDAQFGGSPAWPRLLQLRGPALRPMSAPDGPKGRGGWEPGGPPAPLATSTKESAAREDRVGNARVLRPRELQLPIGIGGPCPTISVYSS